MLLVATSHASADFCTIVDDKFAATAASLSGSALAGASALQIAGITAVTHSSGAAILTGSAGYMGSTIGATAATAGFVANPAAIAFGGLLLTGAGGAALFCHQEVFGKLKTAFSVRKSSLLSRFGH